MDARITCLLVAVAACRSATEPARAPAAGSTEEAALAATNAPTQPALPIVAGELRLEGQVIDDEDERPIGGATVILAGSRRALSEADGSFVFVGLAAGDYPLVVEQGDYYGEESATLADDSDPVTVKLTRGATLVVHVLDAATRAPIAGAHVETTSRKGDSGGDGTVRLRGISSGTELIEVTAAEHAPVKLRIASDDPHAVLDHTVLLERGAAVAGIVVDDTGRPVPEAWVSVYAAHGTWNESATADANGRWAIARLGPGKHAVYASSDVHIRTPDQAFDHDGITARTDVVVKVARGGELAGIVVDQRGAPVADARVGTGHGSESTDANGKFVVRGLPLDGELEVMATTETAASPEVKVTLARGRHADIRLVVEPSSLAGIVVDTRGVPIDGAIVVARRKSGPLRVASADDYGRFDFGGIEPGDYEIAAQRAAEISRDTPPGVTVKSGNRRIRIALPDTGTIRGRVVRAGVPVPFYGFIVTQDPTSMFLDPKPVRGTDGAFAQRDLAPGPWSVVIVGPGFVRHVIERIELAAGATVDLGDIAVMRGRELAGRVVDARGAPIAGAVVRVSDRRRRDAATTLEQAMRGGGEARTDARGNFRIDGLATELERMRVAATHASGISLERALTDATTTVELVIAPPGSLAGTVASSESSHFVVFANRVDDDDDYVAEMVDAASEFHFEQLPAGEYDVRVGRSETKRVSVRAGQRTTVAFP